jgi:antitoxin (DNA-binding transcriptional repressor) of toxin-antitoxin stability system
LNYLIFRLSSLEMKTLSVTEAARNFSDLVSRVHYRGESALLLKGGRPMVRVVPARSPRTGRELAALWPRLPQLSPEEAEAMARDLADARAALRPIPPLQWD